MLRPTRPHEARTGTIRFGAPLHLTARVLDDAADPNDPAPSEQGEPPSRDDATPLAKSVGLVGGAGTGGDATRPT